MEKRKDKKIILNDKNKNNEESFCLYKGDFINFNKNNKLERLIIFISQFQLIYLKKFMNFILKGTLK